MVDKYSWLQGFAGPRTDGTPLRPCPYDDAYAAKPLRQAYLDAFNAAAVRT